MAPFGLRPRSTTAAESSLPGADITYYYRGAKHYNLQYLFAQGVKARMLSRQNERNFCYDMLAVASLFGLRFISVCLIKSNCYSLIYSSLYFILSILTKPMFMFFIDNQKTLMNQSNV